MKRIIQKLNIMSIFDKFGAGSHDTHRYLVRRGLPQGGDLGGRGPETKKILRKNNDDIDGYLVRRGLPRGGTSVDEALEQIIFEK